MRQKVCFNCGSIRRKGGGWYVMIKGGGKRYHYYFCSRACLIAGLSRIVKHQVRERVVGSGVDVV